MLLSKVLNDYYVLPLGQSEIVGFDKINDKTDLWAITWHDSDECDNWHQEFLDQEIQENAHFVRGSFVVTNTHGTACAFVALDGADLITKLPAAVIVMQGGLIQEVTTNQEMTLLVIDYDTEGTQETELTVVDQGDGKTEKAITWLADNVNAQHMDKRIAKYLATDGKEC